MAWRLQHVGWRLDELFEADAVDRVAAYARGLPRMINQLCYAALHTATKAGLARISVSSIEAAAGWVEFDLPRPAELPRDRPTERWAREVASAVAILRAGARGTGAWALGSGRGVGRAVAALLAEAGRRVGRGARAGAGGVASTGAVLAAGGRDVCVSLGHGIAGGVRVGVRGVASAGAMLGAGVTGVGAGLVAAGHGVGRAARAGLRAVSTTGVALWAGLQTVGGAVATATDRVARGVRIVHGIASAGAMLGAGVTGVGAGLVAAGHGVDRTGRAGLRAVLAPGAALRAGFRTVGAAVETVPVSPCQSRRYEKALMLDAAAMPRRRCGEACAR
jgi:hypothetical protein